jgi:Bacterial nucleoid DNA-binding protein
VTKEEMAKAISDDHGVPCTEVKAIVQQVLDGIIETLVSEGRIELRNFGVFEVKKRKARQGRNPRTGEKVFVPEKAVVTFKPGREMEARVSQSAQANREDNGAVASDSGFTG